MAYYQLLVSENAGQSFYTDFGDRDKDAVVFEMQDMKDRYDWDRQTMRVRMVTLPRVPTQRQLLALVADVNARAGA